MLVYWILFAYFVTGAVIARPSSEWAQRRPNLLYTVGAIMMCLAIGLRYKVGGDWNTYVFMYHHAGRMDFWQALSLGDPGYQIVNWVAYQVGAGVWLVNLICATLFVWGLFRFCRMQPAPWLAVVVAIPYMVIVMAMGYTRQAVALGILMAGIAAFMRAGSLLRFAGYVIAAAFFHKTAVIAFPVVALATQRNRFTNLLLVAAAGIALYDAFLGDAMDDFVQNYVNAKYSSQGAAVRILMNIVSAGIFWISRNHFEFGPIEKKVWRNFAIASVVSLIGLILIPSSAAVDRISLYLIPLQIVVLARVPTIFRSRIFGVIPVLMYCFAVEFVWLNFAQFARLWVPYRLFPL